MAALKTHGRVQNVEPLELVSTLRALHPQRVLPKPAREVPELYGVQPSYAVIHSLKPVEGRFFTEADDRSSSPVCVLGEKAKVNLLGYGKAAGQFVKVNDTWLEVVGVLSEQAAASGQSSGGGQMEDRNNVVFIPSTRSITATGTAARS